MDGKNKFTSNTADREIAITRLLNAHRELVWKVWTDPQHIKHWWGPNGFTNTIHKMDVRPGGEWLFIMHGPDGVDYKNKIIYIEVTKPEKIVYDHVSTPKFRTTVTFEEQDNKTKLNMQMHFDTAEERDRTIEKFGAKEGLNQTINKLAAYITKGLTL